MSESTGEATLEERYRLARERFPRIAVAFEPYAAYVTARLFDAEPSDEVAADLYLACACASGDPRAAEELDRTVLSLVPQFVVRIESRLAAVDEIRQRVRAALLVASDGELPRIAQYAGRGRLSSWVRVVTIRTALEGRSSRREEVPSEAVDELLTTHDPELSYLRQRYACAFREAFVAALDRLEGRDRAVLRMHLVDGLAIDHIGELYDVHRATAARWIGRARQELFEQTRTELQARLGLSATEFDSIVALVRSELDVSICRLLRDKSA